jgi:competence protein ComEC
MGGLAGAIYAAEVGVALCPVTQSSSEYFSDVVKALAKQNKTLTVPAAGDTFELGSARVTVLGPRREYEEVNDTSLVLKVEYGATSFLFTGDMEYDPEIELVESGADLSATVLKVGHHGSSSSTCYRFLREVMPEYAVIQVGTGNKYGHPTETVLSRLEDAGAVIYRNDLHGTIVARSDGNTVTFTTEKGTAP